MSLFRFLKGKWLFLVASLFTALFCGVLLTGLGADLYASFFVSGVFVAGLFAALLLEYLQKRRFYQELEQNLQALDRKYLLAETLEEPDFPEGQLCWRALCEAGRSMNDEIAACRRAEEEYREYVEVWVHEVKTPIASALLLAENHPGEVSSAMIRELRRIDALVEQSMFYARSRQVEKDYLLRRITLSELVSSALRRSAGLLIESHAAVERVGLDEPVAADPKWIDFILSQLLTNSVKYAGQPLRLRFEGKAEPECVVLAVTDNGPGIPPEDLPRVCEKGFTGKNGRSGTRASGMGLYLCRVLCEKMGMNFAVESPPEGGTRALLRFPRSSLIEGVCYENVRKP